jgi:hypothetical protein
MTHNVASRFTIPVPPLIDKYLHELLVFSLKSCFWRCYLLDITEEDIEAMFIEIQNSLPLEEREAFIDWLKTMPINASAKVVTVLNFWHLISARAPQGQGLKWRAVSALAKYNRHTRTISLAVASFFYKKFKGKLAKTIVTRTGGKILPWVGLTATAYEVYKACKCWNACKDDEYTNSDR